MLGASIGPRRLGALAASRRALLGLATAAVAGSGSAMAQALRRGGEVPTGLFVDARFVGSLSIVHIWQGGRWPILAQSVAGMPAARPTEMFSSDLTDHATARTAAVVARVMRFRAPGGEPASRPRFFLVDAGPHDPTSEEKAERVDVTPLVYLRDATEDFPSPIPRAVRVVAMMTVVHVGRDSADPGRTGQWMSEPLLAMETVAPGAAETRVLDVLEAQLARLFTLVVPARP